MVGLSVVWGVVLVTSLVVDWVLGSMVVGEGGIVVLTVVGLVAAFVGVVDKGVFVPKIHSSIIQSRYMYPIIGWINSGYTVIVF